jgi:hypothetical protein
VRNSKRYSRKTGSESPAISAHLSGLENRPRDEARALGPEDGENDRATTALLVPGLGLGSKATFSVSESMRQMRLGVPQQMVDRTLLRSAIRTRCQPEHRTMGRSIPG